jgi:hypothetical protein
VSTEYNVIAAFEQEFEGIKQKTEFDSIEYEIPTFLDDQLAGLICLAGVKQDPQDWLRRPRATMSLI